MAEGSQGGPEEESSATKTEEATQDTGNPWDKKLEFKDPTSEAYRKYIEKKTPLATRRDGSSTPISDFAEESRKTRE